MGFVKIELRPPFPLMHLRPVKWILLLVVFIMVLGHQFIFCISYLYLYVNVCFNIMWFFFSLFFVLLLLYATQNPIV